MIKLLPQKTGKSVRRVIVLAWKLEIDGMCVVCNGNRSTEFLSGRVR